MRETSKPHSRDEFHEALEYARLTLNGANNQEPWLPYEETWFTIASAYVRLFEQLESLRTALTIIKDRDPAELGYIQFVQHIALEALAGSNPASGPPEPSPVDVGGESGASVPASVPEREGGEQNPTSALSPTPNSIRQRAEGESRSETSAEQSPASERGIVIGGSSMQGWGEQNQHSGRCPSCGLSPYESGIGDADISRIVAERNRLVEQEEDTDKLLREIQRALWHAGFGRGQGRSELDGLFAALGAELGAYPATKPFTFQRVEHLEGQGPDLASNQEKRPDA